VKTLTSREWTRRSQLCFGVAVICVLFLVETAVAHRSVPHPASPIVWGMLGLVGTGAVAAGIVCRLRARRTGQAARR
jgi:hypothetical protein